MKKILYFFTRQSLWGYLLLLGVFIINGLYLSFPDEFVNLLGARTIMEGKMPYKDFFDHHLPLAWFLGADLLRLSFGNFVVFRILFAIFMFGCLFLTGLHIKRSNPGLFPYFLVFFVIYPFFAVYFWLHIFIADALATLFFSCAFWLTINETYRFKSNPFILAIAGFLNFALVFSSLTYIFVAAALYLWQLYLVWRDRKGWQDVVFFLVAAALPYSYYGVHLVVTNSVADFYRSNFTYNTEHYISIEEFQPGQKLNPIRFAMTIVQNFWDDYLPLLSKIKHLDLYLPIGTLAGISTLLLLLVFGIQNRILFVLFFLILSFSAPRSNIQEYAETNYQMGLFLALGLASACVVLYRQKSLRFQEEFLNVFRNASVFVMVTFLVFTSVFLAKNTFEKAYKRYMLLMPGINDRSFVAEFVEEFLPEGEYFWIGPYEPHHAFFVRKGKLPGKYPTLLPQFRESEFYRNDFLKQFEENPPAVIIFKNDASIFMTPATEFGKFFIDWMRRDYIRVSEVEGYAGVRNPWELNVETDVYLRKDMQSELIRKLEAAGYVARP
ncbi:MAG: hypothetical protein N2691_00610 [Patescibacteria group bacterium]|nr:hypothetical protein [Patescibacteria group bacterium]